MEHSFDIEFAQKYGINAAVVFRHLQFWIIKNKTHSKNFHDGRTWTYYSVKAFTKIFPYLTQKQVRNALQILLDNGVILKGNYNKRKNVRTSWYAFSDENTFAPEGKCSCPRGQMELPQRADGIAPQGKSNTDKDKSTDEKTDKPKIFQKEDLSSKDSRHSAFSLLLRYGVDSTVANSIVFDQNTPPASIIEVVKNGLAKEVSTGGEFTIGPGYIVKALNQARSEGKVVGPTKISRELGAKLRTRTRKHEPLSKAECQKRVSRQKAALGIS